MAQLVPRWGEKKINHAEGGSPKGLTKHKRPPIKAARKPKNYSGSQRRMSTTGMVTQPHPCPVEI